MKRHTLSRSRVSLGVKKCESQLVDLSAISANPHRRKKKKVSINRSEERKLGRQQFTKSNTIKLSQLLKNSSSLLKIQEKPKKRPTKIVIPNQNEILVAKANSIIQSLKNYLEHQSPSASKEYVSL